MTHKLSSILRNSAIAALVATAAACAIPAMAHSPFYYTGTSAMASGHWAKIKVSDEGIHQITYDQLHQMGFADPTKVKVCGYGGTLLTDNRFSTTYPDDIHVTASVHTSDGRVLFYASPDVRTVLDKVTDADGSMPVTVTRNIYSLDTYYLLTDADLDNNIQPDVAAGLQPDIVVDMHWAVQLFEPEEHNPGEGGAVFHSRSYASGEKMTLPFNVSNFVAEQPAYIGAYVAAGEFTRLSTYHPTITAPQSLTATMCGQGITIASLVNRDYKYNNGIGGYALKAADVNAGIPDGELNFTLNWTASNNLDYAALDYAWLVYTRRSIIDRNRPGGLLMQFSGTGANWGMKIAGADADAMIWNVSDPVNIRSLETTWNSDEQTVTAALGRAYNTGSGQYVAFNPADQQLPVTVVGSLPNQNIHGDETPNMVIITTDALYNAAKQLAEIHQRHDGIKVNVYTQKQIFNEFSSGTPCAMAYRRMLKMFYDRDPETLRYAMLYGGGTWDNRNVIITSPHERLLVYEVELLGETTKKAIRHTNLNFVSDNYFGMLADTFVPDNIASTKVNIAVGRVPMDSEPEGLQFNNKVDQYLSNLPTVDVYSRVLLVSDNGDSNQHLQQSEELATTMSAIQPSLTFTRAHVSIYPQTNGNAVEAKRVLSNSLIKGVGYFTYSGHGRPTDLAGEYIWTMGDVDKTSYAFPPLGMFSTCDTYEMDRNNPGIAEAMVKRLNGGTIASVAATRSVYLEHNQNMSQSVATEYARATPGSTIGDIYRNAHNLAISISTNDNARFNTMCYNLCGDPAIRLAIPSLQAAVATVNGKSTAPSLTDNDESAETNFDVAPLSQLNLTGTIINADGTTDASFNGTANITLYDGAHAVPVIIVDTSGTGDKEQDITLEETTLAATAVNVKDGIWEASLLVPYPNFPADRNRIVVTATENTSEVLKRSAAGLFDRLRVTNDEAGEFTADSPIIEEFYINTPSFADGDIVASDFNVHATIRLSESGVSKNGGIGGAGGKLILDGRSALDGADGAIVINTDGTATMDMPLTEIEDGRHTLTLQVADAMGSRVSATLAFTVVNASASGSLALEKTLVRDQAVVDLTHSFGSDSALTTRLIFKDVHGNTVHSVANPAFPYTWNLKDNAGRPVADGRYTVSATATDGNAYTSTAPLTITVIR